MKFYRSLAVILVLTQAIGLQMSRNARRVHADTSATGLNLSEARSVAAVYRGSANAVGMLRPGAATPVSMATDDFDLDGAGDLAVGFATRQGTGLIAIHHGDMEAFAPHNPATFQAIAQGNSPSPYRIEADVVEIPLRPDFLAAGDVFGQKGSGLVAAARGGSTIGVLARNASGKMEIVQSIAASGAITALSTHQLQAGKYAQVVVGAHGLNGAELDIYSGSDAGLSQVSSFALAGDATSFVSGNLDGDGAPDLLVVAGGQVSILHGASQTLESVPVPYTVFSAVLGRFAFDRNGIAQISLLATDGSVHVLAENGLDARPFTSDEVRALRLASRNKSAAPVPAATERAVSWNEVESYPAAATFGSNGQTPKMFRTRISGNGADDILVLSSSRASLVEHSDVNPASGVVIERSDLAINAAAALTTRVNFDARPGLVYVPNGGTVPLVQTASASTFYPNRADDPTPPANLSTVCTNTSNTDMSSSCSLREAVLKANADTGNTDTIMLANATYQLTIAKVAGDYSGKFGALYLNNSMNITGQGSGNTIIQSGASAGHGVDLVIAVNEDISTQTTASVSITGVTIQFGTNKGTLADGNGDQDGGGMMFDTGRLGTSTLSLTDVILNNNQTTDGDGGGIALFSSLIPTASGNSTFTNCVIEDNSTSRTAGFGAQAGGIWVSTTNGVPAVTTLNSTTVTSNQTKGTGGIGGGIKLDGPANGHTQSALHGGTISNNTSTAEGGGIYTNAGLTIDMEMTITGNSAGTSGGGIWMNISPDTANFSNITVAGNAASAGAGGGIHVDGSGGTVNITNSRLTGNTATSGGKDLDNTATGSTTKVTATDDWWGTNAPGTFGISTSTSTCPATAGKICFEPNIVLGISAGPSTIKINGTSTVTASVFKDNMGGNVSDSTVLNGLPAGGDIFSPGAGSSAISGDTKVIESGTAQETYTAGSTPASVKISATLDDQTLTVTINVVAPPTITKSFNPTTVAPSGKTTITFGLSNPNTVAIDASFTDTLPAGMAIAAVPNVTNTCGGTPTATALAGSVSYTNATLAANTTCSITVDVTAPATDQVATNTVTLDSTAAGNSTPASANLTVISAPQIGKAFTASVLLVGGSTTLTLTVTNPNTSSTINGIAFTDTFPSGLTVAASPGLSTTCNATPTATGGGSTVSLTGASLAAGTSCTVAVSVTGVTGGSKINSVSVTSTNAGTGNTASATVNVVAPPSLTKAFGVASIPVGQSTTLTFTLNNPDASSLTGVGFTDTLPAGLMVSSPNGLTNTCGGAAAASGSSISLSGVTLTASAVCTLTVSVTGTSAGTETNTTSAITSNEAGNGTTATAMINVIAAPSIAASFSPNSIGQGATTTLTLTITNPAGNPATLMGVAVTDTLPAGLTVATGSSPMCGGTLATTNPATIQLTGASIATGAQCSIAVTVTGAAAGQYTNTTGAVTSSNGGTGNTGSAGLTVTGADLTVAVTNAGYFGQGQLGDEFILTVSNVGSGPTNGTLVTVTDSMPSGFTVTQIAGSGWTCTTSPLQCTRTDVLGGGSSYAPITISVNISQTATTPETNTATVSGGGDINPANNSGSDTVTIVPPGRGLATLTGLITARSGPTSGRIWTITVTNTDSAMAANAEITGLTLTQTSGTACTPVVDTIMPVMLGTIGPSSTAAGTVTIDFSSCTGTPRFKVVGTFIANGGTNTGTMTLNNQVQ